MTFVSSLPVYAISATNFNPADDATGVSVTANLVITFDEAWNDGSMNYITIYDANGGTFEQYDMIMAPAEISGSGTTTLTINPSSSFANSTNYYVQIDDMAVYDSGFMNTYSITDTTTYNFQTEGTADVTAPSRISISPSDNSSCAFADNNLVITFDENIDVKTGNVTIKLASDDSTFETIDVTSGKVTGNGGTAITINPANGMAANTAYYVEIDATAFDDESGNSYAGFTTNGTWNFTTDDTSASWYDSAWSYRIPVCISSAQVNGDLSNFPIYVNLADINGTAGFFENVLSTGADIRMTKSDGTSEVAREIVDISTSSNAGEMYFIANGTLSGSTDTKFYIYYGNGSASEPSVSSQYGSENVWYNNYVGVWHLQEEGNTTADGYEDSSTKNDHGTGVSMTSSSDVSAQINNGQELDGSSDYINIGDSANYDFGSGDFELSGWFKHDNTGVQDHLISKDSNTNGRQWEFRTDGSGGIRFNYFKSGAAQVYKDQSNVLNDTNWHYLVAQRKSSSLEIFKDGVLIGNGTTSGTHGAMQSTNAPVMIGRREYSGFTEEFDGKIDEVRIASTAHSAGWVDTEYNNQSSSSTFYAIGSQEEEPVVDTTPTDWYSSSWNKRIKITIDSGKINGDLSNFPIYVDLDDMPDSFFDDVDSAGADIRVTKSDGATEVAREVVWINTTANLGEMHFVANGTLSSSADTSFYIYYNGTASEPAEDATYGSENVWDSNFVAIYHFSDPPGDGTAYDATSGDNDATLNGSMDANDIDNGGVGKAYAFDGSDDYLALPDISGDFGNNGTMSLYANLDSLTPGSGYRGLTCLSTSGDDELYGVTSGADRYFYYTSFKDNRTNAIAISDRDTTNWHHIVTVQSPGTLNYRVYFDGHQVYSEDGESNVYMSTSPRLGSSCDGSEDLQGKLSEARISKIDRSNDWNYAESKNFNSPSTFYTVGTETNKSTITAISYEPSDGSTEIQPSDNLVINFDKQVNIQTGNITIKKLSDDSTFETIDISSGKVTGNGSTALTINPANGMDAGTAYYINIDATAIDDTGGNSYVGISDNGTWNFTTASWYNSAWTKRTKLTVNSSKVDADLTNFPIYVNLDDLPDSFFDDVDSAGADIRVTKADGIAEVAREVVYLSASDNAGEMYFVANGTLSSSSDTVYYIYYGNSAATEPEASATYGSQNVWDSNYEFVYHMQEDPTGTIIDSTSNQRNAVDYNDYMESSDLSAGRMSNGYSLDGSNETFGPSNMDLTAARSMSIWFKPDSGVTTGTGHLFMMGSSDLRFSMYQPSMAKNSYRSYYQGTGCEPVYDYITNDTWHYMTMTHDGSTTFNTYINNDQTACSVASGTESNQIIYIGYISDPFGGIVDEARYSKIERSLAWHRTEYNNMGDSSSFYSVSSIVDEPDFAVTTLTPVDGANPVSLTNNLSIAFNDIVNIGTGNITIKKLSDDSTFEAIDITSGQVTGNGTTTLSIDPSSDFDTSTTYYVTIDATAIDDDDGNSFAGYSTNGDWNFTTACSSQSGVPWYNCSWQKRTKITIDSDYVNGDLTDFPVYVDLANAPANFFNDINVNGSDIRMTSSDGITELPREVVKADTTNNAGELYFKASTLSGSSNSDFYLYYDNDSATEPSEDATYGRENVWDSNYVLVYHFNEDPTGTTTDSTANDHDGSEVGSMTSDDLISTLTGDGYDFDGSNDYIDTGGLSELIGATAVTFFNIYKRDQANDNPSFGMGTSSTDYLRFYQSSTSVYWVIKNNNTQAYGRYSENDSNWHYSHMVFDGFYSGNNSLAMRYYRDGAEVTATSFSGTIPASLSGVITSDFHIGDTPYSNAYADGPFDEFRVSDIARPEAWSDTMYNNFNGNSSFLSFDNGDTGSFGVSSFTPADNESLALVDTNLTIVFNDTVDIQAGDLTIKQLSNGSTVETIDLTGGQVTGNGTTTIVINPASDLTAGTDYYINIDASAFSYASGGSYEGISDNGTWNFTTACGVSGDAAWYDCAWNKRIILTVDANYVNGDLNNFPVYLNLGDLNGTTFFDDVDANGADLRITDSDNNLLPREVVSVDTTNNAGELHFKASSLSGTSNSTFYLYYDNDSATEPAEDSTYGKENVWTEGYVGVWHLNDYPTGTVYDSTSSDYDGTSAGSMTTSDLVAGQVGNGMDFDGSNDYIDVGDVAASIESQTHSTLSFFYQRHATNDQISMTTGSGWWNQYGVYQSGGNMIFFPDDASNYASYADGDTDWHYFMMIFNGDETGTNSAAMQLYHDGSKASLSFTGTIPATVDSAITGDFHIGQNIQQSLETDGILDEVRITTDAKSPNWAVTEYNNLNSPSTFFSFASVEDAPDADAPVATSFSPADGASSVAVDTNLVIGFDETVVADNGDILIKLLANGTTVQTLDINDSGVVTISTNQVTLNPGDDLSPLTDYYITINGTAIDDSYANSYAGISDNGTWNFTTAAANNYVSNGWVNSAWTSRIKLTMNGDQVNGDLTDFPVYVDLSDLSSTDFFSNVRSDGGDIRVTQGDGLTLLPTELVSIDTTNNQGELWFKAPFLDGSSDTIFYIYYNNANGRPLNAAHPLGKNNVWTNGYVAVYHMDEDPNGDPIGVIRNSVSNSLHGTPSGTMTSADKVAGQIGNGTDFDGSNDYISTADTGLQNIFDGAGNVSFWFNADSDGQSNLGTLLEKDISATEGWQLVTRDESGGNIRLIFQQGFSGAYGKWDTPVDISINNWHNLSMNYDADSSANNPTLHVDSLSVSLTESNAPSGTRGSDSGNSLIIANRHQGDRTLDGTIDEVRLSNKTRSADWIKTEYNNQSSPSTFYTVGSTVDGVNDDGIPKPVLTYPANRQDRFPLRANLFIEFNENVQAGSGNITIKKVSDGSTFEQIAIGSATISGARVTINPSSNLASGTEYYIEIDDGAIEDLSSNAFIGFRNNQSWRFTTEGGKATTTSPNNIFQFGF